MINILKIGSEIYQNFEEKTTNEDGSITWNIPTNLNDFKKMASDTINWQIGSNVKKAVGNTYVNLSASNAKAIILLSKVLASLNPNLDGFTELETDSYNKMTTLADDGYADSELLNASLTNVSEFIASATDKVARVTQAESIDDVITILNE